MKRPLNSDADNDNTNSKLPRMGCTLSKDSNISTTPEKMSEEMEDVVATGEGV